MILIFGFIIFVIIIIGLYLADKEEKEEAEKNPIKLVYDPTKARPWCVQKWNGVRYVQVSGWFANEENARKVYKQMVSKR